MPFSYLRVLWVQGNQEIQHLPCFLMVQLVQVVQLVQEILDYLQVQDFQRDLVVQEALVDLMVLNYQKDLVVLKDQVDHLTQLAQGALMVPENLWKQFTQNVSKRNESLVNSSDASKKTHFKSEYMYNLYISKLYYLNGIEKR